MKKSGHLWSCFGISHKNAKSLDRFRPRAPRVLGRKRVDRPVFTEKPMIKDVARSPALLLVGLCAVGLSGACSSTQSAEEPDASGKGGTGGVSAAGSTTSGGGTMAVSSSAPSGGGTTGNAAPAGGSRVVSSTPNVGTTSSDGRSAAGGVTSAGGSTVTGGTASSGGASSTGEVRSSGGVTAASGSEPAGGNAAASSDAGANDVRSSDASKGEKDATSADTLAVSPDASRDSATGKSDAAATVSFKTQIEPLLKTNCTSCHGATVQNMNVRVDTYANLKASLSDVTDLLVNGGMPPAGPLSDADIQLFQSWVDQGALNN